MKKKIISITLALIMLLGVLGTTALALSGVTVILDGKTLSFDVPPQIINGRTMVPLRVIFEAMGATIAWDGGSQTATATKGDTVVVLKIGSTSPTINGQAVTIDQPGLIVNGRTLAPLRFVAEAFGGVVAWDGGTQTASITMGMTAPPTPTTPPGGNSGIVGRWEYMLNYWIFYDDGHFDYVTSPSPQSSVYEGRYLVSNGRIYLTNTVSYPNIIYKDQVLEFSFGTNAEGEYLFIPQYEPLSNVYGGEVSTWTPKEWRRDN